MHYESANERWSPVQSVEKILLSVVSMLAGTSRLNKNRIARVGLTWTRVRNTVTIDHRSIHE